MLTVNRLVFNPFDENTYIIAEKETGKALVVDPGMFVERECQQFDAYIKEKGFKLELIVNTHLHLDHSFGINYVRENYGVKLAAHPNDEQLGLSIQEQGLRFGFGKRNDKPVTIDIAVADDDEIKLGNSIFKVLHVPGHSQGGIAIYCEAEGFALVGDSIFRGSIGRTDLVGGNQLQLVECIHNQLMSLPKETTLFPGHGPHTTVGIELETNPYL